MDDLNPEADPPQTFECRRCRTVSELLSPVEGLCEFCYEAADLEVWDEVQWEDE